MPVTDVNLDPDTIHFIPLGGSEEFGCNFNAYAYKGKWLLMDCGIGFADHRFPMIDILLPKTDFIEKYKEDILGLIVTHGHEDHIGAVPYLWPRLSCPVYCTHFTAEVMRRKLSEFPESKDMPVTEISAGKRLDLGPFGLDFIRVTHSIPEAVATVINTDEGTIIHTGDWNLDTDPAMGKPVDPHAFIKAGEKNVLAYVGDSTNAQVPGRTPSESLVEAGLTEVLKMQKKTVAITTFSSNLGRLKSISKAARAANRSVCIVGRSLKNMVGAGMNCGLLDDIPDFVDEEDLDLLPRENVVLVVTGSQGESRAALSRISRGEFKGVSLEKGDTVIFSSRDIPGNEKDINGVKNSLIASGITVINDKSAMSEWGVHVHVSGHPCRDELKDMISWIKPQIAVPVHGERMMTEAHAELARECGVPHTVIPSNGSVIALDPTNPRIINHVETGFIGVEPKRLIDTDNTAISARRKLQYTGAAFVTITLDQRCRLVRAPEISTLGLEEADSDDIEALNEEIIDEIKDTLIDINKKDWGNDHIVSEELRIVIRRLLTHIYGFKPQVVVHLVRSERS